MIQVGPCYSCRAEMSLPEELYRAAKRSPRVSFYCAYGHEQIYPEGPTVLDTLRQERDRLAQRLAEKDDTIRVEREAREAAERSARAVQGHMTRLRRRVMNGVCPCCSRRFENLSRHMASKHPDYIAEEPA
ncbi:hypothetical protein CH340_07965 [Rhodoplanes serenus]|nr:hypothetical protein CH340_07965 [Rhodoplanes serenus]